MYIIDLYLQETGALKLNQLTQLASARHSLMVKMQQLVARRKEIACLVQTGGQELAGNQQPLFGSIAQVCSQSRYVSKCVPTDFLALQLAF